MSELSPEWFLLSRAEAELANRLVRSFGPYAIVYVSHGKLETALTSGRVRLRDWSGIIPEHKLQSSSVSISVIDDRMSITYWKQSGMSPPRSETGEHRYVEVDMVSLERYARDYLLPATMRQHLSADAASPPAIGPRAVVQPFVAIDAGLHLASIRSIREAIQQVYDCAAAAHRKPPEHQELAAPVQKLLASQGFTASANSIQKAGSEEQFKKLRRPPGPRWTG